MLERYVKKVWNFTEVTLNICKLLKSSVITNLELLIVKKKTLIITVY